MNILHVSSYPPTRCGIATYTAALLDAWKRASPDDIHQVLAVDVESQDTYYNQDVCARLSVDAAESYVAATAQVNQGTYTAALIQHEYRLFGGQDGDYILKLLEGLSVPTVLVVHLVYTEPTRHQCAVTRNMAKEVSALVVHTNAARATLMNTPYNIDPAAINVIPHGTRRHRPFRDRQTIRAGLGVIRGPLLLTCGLLRRDKGIEYAIRALPLVLEKHPTAQYFVVGNTHPGVLRREGGRYRAELESLIQALGLVKHVHFIDEFVNANELDGLMAAADIYLAPYTSNQTTSGTVAQAVVNATPVLANPFQYAQEVLVDGSGIIVDFVDKHQAAASIIKILADQSFVNNVRKLSRDKAIFWDWDSVWRQYYSLIRSLRSNKRCDR